MLVSDSQHRFVLPICKVSLVPFNGCVHALQCFRHWHTHCSSPCCLASMYTGRELNSTWLAVARSACPSLHSWYRNHLDGGGRWPGINIETDYRNRLLFKHEMIPCTRRRICCHMTQFTNCKTTSGSSESCTGLQMPALGHLCKVGWWLHGLRLHTCLTDCTSPLFTALQMVHLMQASASTLKRIWV
jgi:hypothetical protein